MVAGASTPDYCVLISVGF